MLAFMQAKKNGVCMARGENNTNKSRLRGETNKWEKVNTRSVVISQKLGYLNGAIFLQKETALFFP